MIQLIIGKKGQGKTTYLKKHIKNSLARIIIFDVNGEFRELKNFKNINLYNEYRQELKSKKFKINFKLQEAEHLQFLIPAILNTGNMNIYFDESHLVIKQLAVERLIRFARNKEINLYFVSHRIYDFPVLIRGMVDKIIFFRIQCLADLKYIREYVSIVDIEDIKQLDKFNYIDVDMDAGIINKKKLDIKNKK